MFSFNWGQFNVYKIIQLVIIIGGYIVLRQRFVAYMKNKHLKEQLITRKREQTENLIERPERVVEDPISKSEQAWGWGKQTRKKVQSQQRLVEQHLRNRS